ncbi:MAG: translation elongation factor Ts [Candidatus Dojkabacteria bacterium]|nr:translation elongation factor Ts [Candidatus Dojkabacteria bacterium]
MSAKVTMESIKKLRKKTGIGIQDCKEALEKSEGDFDKAVEFLRKKGILKAQKRAGRDTENGYIGSYVHNGQIGVLVELVCETDFVSRNEKFQSLARELAIHIAASAPNYLSREDVPKDVLKKEKEIVIDKLGKQEKKPKEILDKIAEGQMEKFYEDFCLLDQVYVRDEKKKIRDLINEAVAAYGEKIEIRRFVRMILGEEE